MKTQLSSVLVGVLLLLVLLSFFIKKERIGGSEKCMVDEVVSIINQDFLSQGFSPSMYRFSAFVFDPSNNNIPLNFKKKIPAEIAERENLWVVYSEPLGMPKGTVGGTGCFIIDMDSKRVLIRHRSR